MNKSESVKLLKMMEELGIPKLSNVYTDLLSSRELYNQFELKDFLDWIDEDGEHDTYSDTYVKLHLRIAKILTPDAFKDKSNIILLFEACRRDCSRELWKSNCKAINKLDYDHPLKEFCKLKGD